MSQTGRLNRIFSRWKRAVRLKRCWNGPTGDGSAGPGKGSETGWNGSSAGRQDFPPVLQLAIIRGRTGDAGAEEVHPKIRPAGRPTGRGEDRYPQGNRENWGKGFRRGQRQGQDPCAPGKERRAASGHEAQSGQPSGSGSLTVHPRENP